jgi:polyisoprenoid-binding protein YceI
VDGDLSLHGVTKPVVFTVRRAGESYSGHATLKQTDFGIKPISVGGGMIRVKDQMEIEFAIVARH